MICQKLRSVIGSLFSCCFIFLCFSSQSQITPVRTYTIEEDNKPVQINTLYKNNQGYIYAGTSQGLYKFDGIKFSRINFTNPDYTDTVTAIFQDRQGKYWVGFKSGRIANLINGSLVYFNPEEGTPSEKITGFLQDKDNKIWFSTAGEGIYYLKDNRLYLVNAENGLTDENVTAICLTNDGKILAATDQGLNIISTSLPIKITSLEPGDGLPDYIVSAIVPAGKNAFWIGMQDKGFCLYDHQKNKITVPNVVWNYGQVNAMHYTHGSLWITTPDGIIQYKDGKLKQASLHKQLTSILEDAFGNIWYAGPVEGLVRTTGEAITIHPLPEGTVFQHIHALLVDRSNNIWVTNSKNDLIKQTLNDKISSTIIRLNGVTDKTDVTSLYEDKNGNIWVGTMGRGLFILDPTSNAYRSFNENPDFIDASILSISGKDNTVFASSLQGSMAVDVKNADISEKLSYKKFDQSGMESNYIYNIFRDSKERTWFATDGNGVSVFANDRFINHNSLQDENDDRAYSITEDKKGGIWFSTAAGGVYQFNGNNFRNFSIREGLSDLKISAVKTDRSGNITVIHKTGLDILDPETGHVSYINQNSGISKLNVEDLGAVTQDSDGNIYVSSENGIVMYAPHSDNIHRPAAIIESVQLFLTELPDEHNRSFAHDDNNFTFNYTGLYYTDPEEVYYQYKLEGFDSSWIITKDRSRTFPRLDPGKYTFRIQSSLNKNFLNASEASYSFEIRQAFYKQWWFILISLLAASGLLYWYIKSREKNLKKLERLQQEKIQFRFEVLRNQVNPHFLFNSFNTLISTIEDDPKMAVEYVEQLSDFFRNIVNYRDKDIITLQEEMELMDTYLFLQKKRYGENLQLNVSIDEHYMKGTFIPPLTLQLLVENAIKHNAITKDKPLKIKIATKDDQFLTVRNNINVRMSKETSSGMGLQNIINRYHLLTAGAVTVDNTGTDFIVSLPLIKQVQ